MRAIDPTLLLNQTKERLLMSSTRRPARKRPKSRQPLSPEERAERVAAARQQLLDGIDKLMTSEGWERFVTTGAWLRRYSVMNVIMILEQCPGATDVRPLSEWRAAGYGFMRKGTHKIKIWKPVFRKAEPEESIQPTAATAESESGKSELAGFMLVPVVDVSQLQGNPPMGRPQRPTPIELTGDAPVGLWDGVATQIAERGYRIERVDCSPAYGRTRYLDRLVTVRPDVEPAQAAKTLTHELAHILCEHETRQHVSRNVREVEAESVACIVAAVCGLETQSYSVPYVAGWAADRDAARQSAERVLSVAGQILTRLERTDEQNADANRSRRSRQACRSAA